MPDVHAKLSASGSAKWLNCTKSLIMEEPFPNVETAFAYEGTVAHGLGELAVKEFFGLDGVTQTDIDKYISDNPEVGNEMKAYILDGYKEYIAEQRSRFSEKSVYLGVEERIEYSQYAPEGFGTGDMVICDPEKLAIIDLKYGRGVKVSAVENPQLRLYALGFISSNLLFEPKTVEYHIYQPRLDNISVFSEPVKDLLHWGEYYVKPKAKEALSTEEARCKAGEWCDSHFCKARAVCKAYNDMQFEIMRYSGKDIDCLSDDEITAILDRIPKIKKWAEQVEAYILNKLKGGGSVEGYKLVEGVSRRKITDEQSVLKILQEQGLPPDSYLSTSIKGITELTALLGKEQFEKLIGAYVVKPKGKLTLAKADDKRAAVDPKEVNEFADIFITKE